MIKYICSQHQGTAGVRW